MLPLVVVEKGSGSPRLRTQLRQRGGHVAAAPQIGFIEVHDTVAAVRVQLLLLLARVAVHVGVFEHGVVQVRVVAHAPVEAASSSSRIVYGPVMLVMRIMLLLLLLVVMKMVRLVALAIKIKQTQ